MTKIGTLEELGVKPGDVVGIDGNEFAKATILAGKRLLVEYEDGITHELSPGWYYNKCDNWFIISRAAETPKLWRDMTPEEKGALLLAHHEGKNIQWETFGKIRNSQKGFTPCWQAYIAYRIKPERTKSEWSAWFVSKQDGTTKFNLDICAEVDRVALGDGKQFAYRVKKWVER